MSLVTTVFAVVTVLGSATYTLSADLTEVARSLNNKLKDQIVTLRTFYSGSELRFTPDGTLQNQAQTCPWTLCSKIFVSGVKLTNNRLSIKGERMLVYFEGKPLVAKYSHSRSPLEIQVEPVSSEDQVRSALSQIFVGPGAQLSERVPDYWRAVVSRMEQGQPIVQEASNAKPGEPLAEDKNIFSVGGNVKPPRIKKARDPEYPALAQQLRREAKVLLWGVVREDGKIHEVRVAGPVGLGFEEQALKAIETWEFEPALKEGKPVAVQLNIEINFRFR